MYRYKVSKYDIIFTIENYPHIPISEKFGKKSIFSGSYFLGHIFWVIFSGSYLWVIFSGSYFLGHISVSYFMGHILWVIFLCHMYRSYFWVIFYGSYLWVIFSGSYFPEKQWCHGLSKEKYWTLWFSPISVKSKKNVYIKVVVDLTLDSNSARRVCF